MAPLVVSKTAAGGMGPDRQRCALVSPNFVSRSVPDTRNELKREASAPNKCRAVLVGLQAESREVEVIFLRHDGTMSCHGHVHPVPPDRTAVGQAITAFGLTRLRRYSAEDLGDALLYVRHLLAEMDDDAPHIL
jgi:hypothetical protein